MDCVIGFIQSAKVSPESPARECKATLPATSVICSQQVSKDFGATLCQFHSTLLKHVKFSLLAAMTSALVVRADISRFSSSCEPSTQLHASEDPGSLHEHA